jgi:hypothetical protein
LPINRVITPAKKDVIKANVKFKDNTPFGERILSLNASKLIVIIVNMVAIIPIKTNAFEYIDCTLLSISSLILFNFLFL